MKQGYKSNQVRIIKYHEICLKQVHATQINGDVLVSYGTNNKWLERPLPHKILIEIPLATIPINRRT